MDLIEKIINPKSVAVIGASSNQNKIGYQILNNIIKGGFKGEIFAINKKSEKILDLDSVSSITEIESHIDLAIIAIPGNFVLDIVKECISSKVSSIIIVSSGFAETGTAGKAMQEEITSLCQNAGISLLGPNCLGLINTSLSLNASFADNMPISGNIGLISQSGAMISALIDWSRENNIGFSKIFSMGNMAQISELETLQYFYSDQSTKVIVVYLEQLVVSPQLTKTLIENAKIKPTIILFGGKTKSGGKAASSHTGSIVSSFIAIKTYLEQAGTILVDGLDELFYTTKLISCFQKIDGNRVAIITNAGGPSIITCDAMEKGNLVLSELLSQTNDVLKQKLKDTAILKNPIDLLGDATPDDYRNTLEALCNDTNVDGVIILITKQSSTNTLEIAQAIKALDITKPVLPVFIGESFVEESKIISESNIPIFNYPESALFGLQYLVNYCSKPQELLVSEYKNEIFNESSKYELLRKYNLPILEYKLCNNFEELDKQASTIGFPVVLKTADPTIVHKTDVSGVILDIKNNEELNKAFDALGSRIIIGKMLKGIEIFIGVKKDKNVGTVITFGTGGIFAEIYKDFSYRVSPITKEIAKLMISETKIGKILSGARGRKPLNLETLSEVIVNTALFADSFSNINEIDFNPLIANEDGYFIVDARIISDKES